MNLEFKDLELEKLREITKVLTTNGFLVDQAAEWEYALDAIPEGIFIINRDYKIKFINKSLMNKLRIDEKREVYDENCFEIVGGIPEESKKGISCVCDLVKNEFNQGEHYIDNLGGWYKYNRSPIYTKSGKLLGYICILRNITERKLAEQDLSHSLNMINSTFKAAPIGLGVLTLPDRRIVMVNDEFCRLIEYTEDELIGQISSMLYPSMEEFERVGREKHKKVREDGTGSIESQFKTKSGKLIDVFLSTAKVKNGEGINDEAVFSVINITERRKNEDQLNFLLKLSKKSFKSDQDLTQYALDEAVRLSDSEIGYLHFIEDNHDEEKTSLELFTWSSKTMEMCDAEKTKHYPLEKAGIWADCVREGKCLIHNDYDSAANKKGLPKGHVSIKRHMSVPIYDGKEIVAVMGVGNKQKDYSEIDAKQLTVFGNHLWDILKANRAQKKLEVNENKFKTIFELSPEVITIIKFGEGIFVDANEAFFNLTGFNREDVIDKSVLDVNIWVDLEERDKFYESLINKKKVESFNAKFKLKSGEIKNVEMNSRIIESDDEKYVLTITREVKN